MRFLFVGLGSIAAKHIRDLAAVAGGRGAACDISVLRRKASALPEGLAPYNIRQITELDGTVYDAAFITNPTNLHYDALCRLRGRARFYFIEKPIFEGCGYDCRGLGITGENAYVAAPMRHTPTYRELKRIADANSVFSARIICSSYLPEWRPGIDYRKNYSAIKSLGGGVALDLIHEIDYMVGLFGLPERVLNVRGKYSGLETDSDDLSVYIAQYRDRLCEVHLDYFGREYRRECELYTAGGTYTADFKAERITMPGGGVLECRDGRTGLYAEMEYFFDFITGKTSGNLNPPGHGLRVLGISLGGRQE